MPKRRGPTVLTIPGGTVRVSESYVDDADEVEVDSGSHFEHFRFDVRPAVVIWDPLEEDPGADGDISGSNFLAAVLVVSEVTGWLTAAPARELPAGVTLAQMLTTLVVEGAHEGCTPGMSMVVARAGFEPTTPRVGDGSSSAELPGPGRGGGARTRDTGIMSAVLCRLSYTARSAMWRRRRIFRRLQDPRPIIQRAHLRSPVDV